MAFNTNITPGAPPLLWSNIHDAFREINNNFDILVATVGGSGLIPVDFNTLDTNVSPNIDNQFSLGSLTNSWASVHASEYTEIPGNENNGVWLGTAQIKGISGIVELPAGSTVDGNLIIDPTKTFFKEIQINNDLSIVASEFSDSFNLLSGDGIGLAVNSSSDSIEIVNTGVLSVAASSGIAVLTNDGTVTVTNVGVRSLTSTAALPSGRIAGTGINIDGATGDGIKITNTGVIRIVNGPGITVSTEAATGEVQITNSAPAGNTFSQIEVNGNFENRLVADAAADVLNINSGLGIVLVPSNTGVNNLVDTLTISINPVFDLKGSIFGDDSTKIVDAVENKVFAEFFGNLSGIVTGNLNGNVVGNVTGDVLGNVTGNVTGNLFGNTAGLHDGDVTGSIFADDSTMLVDGTNGQIVGVINASDGVNSISMDTVNGVVIGGTAGAQIIGAAGAPVYIGGGTSGSTSGNIFMGNGTNRVLFVSNVIDTDDSSSLIFEPPVTFNTDVTFENELFVAIQLTVNGARVINLAELQSIVSASSSFANFQTRIAALV